MSKKRSVSLLLVLALLIGCAACAGGAMLFDRVRGARSWEKQFDPGDPPDLTVYEEREGYAAEPLTIFSPRQVVSVFEALQQVALSAPAQADSSLLTYIFTFSSAGGNKMSFTLREDGCALVEGKAYEASGTEAVWEAAGIDPQGTAEPQPEPQEDTAPQPEPEPEPSEPEVSEDTWAVFSSEEMAFSFLYNPAYTAQKTEGGGVVLYLEQVQAPAYLTVLHILEGPDAAQYLEEQRYAAQMEYGEALLQDGGAPADLGVEGRSILGIQYAYPDAGTGKTVNVLSLAENLADGSVAVYTGTYLSEQEAAMQTAITDTLRSFYPDASYYTQQGGNAQPSDSAAAGGLSYTLEDYDGGVFTMQLPKGWEIETGGAYASFSFRAWDPANPDVQIFYCGELGPYFKSEAGKQGYQAMSPGDDPNKLLPVLDPATLEGCLRAMNDYQDVYNRLMSVPFNFAKIDQLQVLSEKPISTFFASVAASESVLQASLTSATGAPCIGVFQGSVADVGSYPMNGVDVTPSRCALNVLGIIAPQEQFDAVSAILTQSLSSFRFTEAYIQEGIQATDLLGENAAERSRQNMAMMDEIVRNFTDYIRS